MARGTKDRPSQANCQRAAPGRGVHAQVGRYDGPVAVEARPRLDAHRLRADFPIFERDFNGKPIAFLDSAASSQKPRQVLDTMRTFYETSYANVHRGVYRLAEEATAGYEGAREKVARFVNAPSAREVIFTRSATEGINLVAYAWGLDNLGPGDVVVVTELEHHSNFVPWQYVAKRTGAEFRAIPFDENGELVFDGLDEIAAAGNVKVVANNLVSNSLGTVNPSQRLAAWAHEHGAIMVVDAAQAAPHRVLDVQALDADFVAISSHKMCGPSGIGAAVDYLTEVGLEPIEEHEHELLVYALERLGELEGVTCYGPPAERRAGIVSFNVDGIHPHDVAQVLDWEGVAIRAGHHCTQPLMTRLGVAATCRASFYVYSIPEEVDRLVDGLHKAKQSLG